MANLRNLGLVTTDEHGFLSLTAEGLEQAAKVLERHLLITEWLVGLGVSEETAAEDACRNRARPSARRASTASAVTWTSGPRQR